MSNAVFIGYIAVFFTAWKLLPWIGTLLHPEKGKDRKGEK